MWDFLKQLINPESIIHTGGLGLLLFVIFAETGLFVGFFLPGDALVFISGLFCSTRPELLGVNIFVLLVLMSLSAILGNMAGYWFGRKVGPALFRREDSLLFRKRHLEVTKVFYDKHGGKTLVLGRFLPIIRTFAPILAGVIAVDFRRFMLYNLIGGISWIFSMGLTGYYLGKISWVEKNATLIVIFLMVITLIPFLGLRKKKS